VRDKQAGKKAEAKGFGKGLGRVLHLMRLHGCIRDVSCSTTQQLTVKQAWQQGGFKSQPAASVAGSAPL
jgi:hypothetical protein